MATTTTNKKSSDSEIKYCFQGISIKEEEGEFYSEGFVATTHPDRAADKDVDGDILSKEALQQIVEFINQGPASTNGVGSTRTVSLQHDWIHLNDPDVEPAGMVVPPAELREMDGGHWGVYVKVHHNKKHPQFEDIKYKVEHGYFPGYSIEYVAGDSSKVSFKNKTFRFLKSISNYVGHAFASARKIANPAAAIVAMGYKEISENASEEKKPNKEDFAMTEENNAKKPESETKEQKESTPVAPIVEKKESEAKQESISIKEIKEHIDAKFKETLAELNVESKALKNTNKEETSTNISIKEMKEAIAKQDMFALKEAAMRGAGEDWLTKEISNPKNYTEGFKSNLIVKCVGKGLRISGLAETKDTLVVGDNASAYTQSNVEFADMFAPGIIDTFNNQTTLFGFLAKEQHTGGNYYQWKMIVNKDPNSTSTFVAQGDVSVVKNFSTKYNYQTPLKIARRGISVSDFINRYSARSLPDLFALEVNAQMLEMMNDVNAALFAEVADGTGNAPLGLEAVADSAGNTTLYGYTRSTANRLAPDSAADTYLAVGGSLTESALRTKITHLETEGSRAGDIAIVTSPKVRDYIFNLMDGNRRFNTTEATFGFNRMNVPSYDGKPIIVDSDCNSDALYVIDTGAQGDVIVIGMEPRMVDLGKVGAATEAYVQMDFAHVYKQPRRIGMLDTLSGP